LFGLSRQYFYRAKWRQDYKQNQAIQAVSLVTHIRKDLPRIGVKKLYHILKAPLNEVGVGRDKLFLILRSNNMLIKPVRSYRKTTDSNHIFKKHKNLIEDVIPTRPEQVWVSDITYIGTRENEQYLSLVTDAYSKKIVGYNLADNLNASASIKALNMALKNRKYKDKQLIHHSDRGIQYCCHDYQKRLRKARILCSMTESYDPYANAVAERVNGILKQEFLLEEYNLNLKMMANLVKQSIKKYNEIRPHYSCDMLTPNQMHEQDKVKIKVYKKLDSNRSVGIQ
jgi:transposase InsO family protein